MPSDDSASTDVAVFQHPHFVTLFQERLRFANNAVSGMIDIRVWGNKFLSGVIVAFALAHGLPAFAARPFDRTVVFVLFRWRDNLQLQYVRCVQHYQSSDASFITLRPTKAEVSPSGSIPYFRSAIFTNALAASALHDTENPFSLTEVG